MKTAIQKRNELGLVCGTITATTPSVTVQVDGNDTAISVICSYASPAVGDRVCIQRIRGRRYIALPLFEPQGGSDSWHYINTESCPAQFSSALTNYLGTSHLQFSRPAYRIDSAGIVHMRGICQIVGTPAAGTALFVLPAPYRPQFNAILPVLSSAGTSFLPNTININNDGTVRTQSGLNVNGAYMSFDNVHFPAANAPLATPWTPLAANLTNSWTEYDSVNAPTGYCIDIYGDIHFRGLVSRTSSPTASTNILTLPAGTYPTDYNRLQVVGANGGMGRIDIATTGALVYQNICTGASVNYMSLANLWVPNPTATKWTSMTYSNSWATYSATTYAPLEFAQLGSGLCVYRGLIKGGTVSTVFATAPPMGPYQGSASQIFAAICNNEPGRLDILPQVATGAVSTFNANSFGSGTNAFVSMDEYRWWPITIAP